MKNLIYIILGIVILILLIIIYRTKKQCSFKNSYPDGTPCIITGGGHDSHGMPIVIKSGAYKNNVCIANN